MAGQPAKLRKNEMKIPHIGIITNLCQILPMSGSELKKWQARMGYTYEQAADELGIARSTYAKYIKVRATKTVTLACRYLELTK